MKFIEAQQLIEAAKQSGEWDKFKHQTIEQFLTKRKVKVECDHDYEKRDIKGLVSENYCEVSVCTKCGQTRIE